MIKIFRLENDRRGTPIALLKDTERIYFPWIVAYDFNYQSGEWTQGYYFETEKEAEEREESLNNFVCTLIDELIERAEDREETK